MKTAYLLAFVDITTKPPTVIGAGIHSDDENRITLPLGRVRAVRLESYKHADYGFAAGQLRTFVDINPDYEWLRPLMGKHP